MVCRKGMLKTLAYDWKLNRATEYISRSWSFLLIFMLVLRFVLHKMENVDKQQMITAKIIMNNGYKQLSDYILTKNECLLVVLVVW